MTLYELIITIHDKGAILVEAPTLQAAMRGVREGSVRLDRESPYRRRQRTAR